MVGACKDRLADAFARHGRVPVVRRVRRPSPDDPQFRRCGDAPAWSAGGLVHDGRGAIVLVRSGDGPWWTPGGALEEGETVDDGMRREVREEIGIGLRDLRLLRIINETLTDGARVCHRYFAQFVARAAETDLRPGAEIREARWFRELPPDMEFRDDYAADFGVVVGGQRL